MVSQNPRNSGVLSSVKLKFVIIINVLMAVLVLVYIFHLLSTMLWVPIPRPSHTPDEPPEETLNLRNLRQNNYFDLWWPIGIIIAIIAFAVINIQITMDVILFKSFTSKDCHCHFSLSQQAFLHKSIETCQLWLRMTVAFQVLQIVGFFSSIFYSGPDAHPYFVLFLAIGTIVCRALGIYWVNIYLVDLKSLIPPGFQLQPCQIYFISLAPEFYQSRTSVDSIL